MIVPCRRPPADVLRAARAVFAQCVARTITWQECLTSLRLLGVARDLPLEALAAPEARHHPAAWAGYEQPDDSTGARGLDE